MLKHAFGVTDKRWDFTNYAEWSYEFSDYAFLNWLIINDCAQKYAAELMPCYCYHIIFERNYLLKITAFSDYTNWWLRK